MDNTAIISDPSSSLYLSSLSKPYDPRAAADAQESMKAKLIAIRKKLVEQVRQAMWMCLFCEQWSSKFRGRAGIEQPPGGARVLFEVLG